MIYALGAGLPGPLKFVACHRSPFPPPCPALNTENCLPGESLGEGRPKVDNYLNRHTLPSFLSPKLKILNLPTSHFKIILYLSGAQAILGTLAVLTTPFRGSQLSPKPGELVVNLFAALKFLKFNVIPRPGHRICLRPTGPGLFAVETRPCF